MENRKIIKIGTSGWAYSHWQEIFYPKGLTENKLLYYSKFFETVEINSTFYHQPLPTTCQKWYNQTPNNFIFSIKAPRFITHIRRLKEIKEPLFLFFQAISELKEKRGPILFQFPKNFIRNRETTERIKNLIIKAKEADDKIMVALEFRNESWFKEEIFEMAESNNVALVIADSAIYPRNKVLTADFAYLRMHGPKELFSSNYPTIQLRSLAQEIVNFAEKDKKNVFCYFNNDSNAYAVKNAGKLLDFIRQIRENNKISPEYEV